MKTEENTFQSEGTKKRFAISEKIFSLYTNKNLETGDEISNTHPANDQNSHAIPQEHVAQVGSIYEQHAIWCFYDEHKSRIKIAHEIIPRVEEYSSYEKVSETIDALGKPVSEIIEQSEREQKPILCISDSTLIQACLLINARVRSFLIDKHWKELPDGAMLRNKADIHFEELCANLKIPRRTRAIMNRKNAERQLEIDALNEKYRNENVEKNEN